MGPPRTKYPNREETFLLQIASAYNAPNAPASRQGLSKPGTKYRTGRIVTKALWSSLLTHPLDGGLISRAPKGPYGRAPPVLMVEQLKFQFTYWVGGLTVEPLTHRNE